MIAAAVAAMVGGAFATDLVYDFKATLKTTTGKTGNGVTTKVNFGQDLAGTYWWQAALTNSWASWVKIDSKGVGQLNVPKTATDAQKKAFADAFAAFNIPEEYRGKEKWCASISYKFNGCYRVAGTEKIALQYFTDDCCSTDFADVDGEADDIVTKLIFRFGNFSLVKATKVEYVGEIGTWGDMNGFALAGQGTWSDKLYKFEGDDYAGIKTLSGNIVGIIDDAECEVCCGENPFARYYPCDATSDAGAIVNDADEGTAAYGSFTLKFNKKASDNLNK